MKAFSVISQDKAPKTFNLIKHHSLLKLVLEIDGETDVNQQ